MLQALYIDLSAAYFRTSRSLILSFLTASSEAASRIYNPIGRRFDAIQIRRINLNETSAVAFTLAYRAFPVQGSPSSPASPNYRFSCIPYLMNSKFKHCYFWEQSSVKLFRRIREITKNDTKNEKKRRNLCSEFHASISLLTRNCVT